MKTIVHEIPYSPASNLDEEIFTASSVFFDIETTGFSPAHTSLYLIGCAYHIEQMLYIKQFFAETPEEEKEVLEQFLFAIRRFCHSVKDLSVLWRSLHTMALPQSERLFSNRDLSFIL